MKYTQITIIAPAEWEEALTMVLFAHGAPGLEIDAPAIIAAHLASGSWDASVFDGQTLDTGRVTLRALFPADMFLPPLYADIAALSPWHESLFHISASALPEQDWQQVWRESFPTLRLGRRLVVMPHWRKEDVRPGETALYIAPGLVFGTGDHATTALAAELLEQYLQPQSRVLDAGCGSGILALAALKLGAAQALAVDNDPVCANSVAEHCALNGVSEAELPFMLGDIVRDAQVQAACRVFAPNLLLANIVAGVVAELAAPAAAFMARGGLMICSGILCEKEQQVLAAFSAAGWQVLERRERAGWLAFVARLEAKPPLFEKSR